jgi:hypothetical protein
MAHPDVVMCTAHLLAAEVLDWSTFGHIPIHGRGDTKSFTGYGMVMGAGQMKNWRSVLHVKVVSIKTQPRAGYHCWRIRSRSQRVGQLHQV